MRLAGPMPAQLTTMRGDTVIGRSRGDGFFRCGTICHVAVDRDAVDVDRDLGGGLLVDVENRNLGAGLGQHAGGGGAEPGSAAGDDRGLSPNVHDQFTF